MYDSYLERELAGVGFKAIILEILLKKTLWQFYCQMLAKKECHSIYIICVAC